MIVRSGIKASTCTTIAAAPANPPPPAFLSASTRSKLASYEIPRPAIAMAKATGRAVMTEVRNVENSTYDWNFERCESVVGGDSTEMTKMKEKVGSWRYNLVELILRKPKTVGIAMRGTMTYRTKAMVMTVPRVGETSSSLDMSSSPSQQMQCLQVCIGLSQRSTEAHNVQDKVKGPQD